MGPGTAAGARPWSDTEVQCHPWDVSPPTFATFFVIFRWALWQEKIKGESERKVGK